MGAVERLLFRMKGTTEPTSEDAPPPLDALMEEAETAVFALKAHPFLPSDKLTASERGHHGRRRAGPGDTFWQYRQFAIGDSQSDIDWRRSGRGDALYIRQQEWETAETLWVLVDFSPSMMFSSQPSYPTKAERGAVIGLALSVLAANAGERLGWYHSGRARTGHTATRALADDMTRAWTRTEFDLSAQTKRQKNGYVLLISDFLEDEGKQHAFFQNVRNNRLTPICVMVRDPLEDAWAGSGRVHLKGCEGEEPLILSRADDVAETYAKRQKAHFDVTQERVRAAGGQMFLHRTDTALSDLLAEIAPTLLSMGDW